MVVKYRIRNPLAAVRESTCIAALSISAIGGVLLAAGENAFALPMSNFCGVRTAENAMSHDYCVNASSNPVTKQLPEPPENWPPGDRPDKPTPPVTCRSCTDHILWQHTNGTVHYWSISGNHRSGGADVGGTGPVGSEWRLIGAGDLDGDGNDDILWQSIGGLVHYWTIKNGQRQGGFDISHGPVGAEWRLIGTGDLDGDGTDDILWQHVNGSLHFWQMKYGQHWNSFNIGSAPVGHEWKLIGTGDMNGDGTDDILWRHVDGRVHYWPIKNGQPQRGIDIGTGRVGPEWRLVGAGDFNSDGTDDILWQHADGTVHYWPIKAGTPQPGITFGATGPVGREWRLIGAGYLRQRPILN